MEYNLPDKLTFKRSEVIKITKLDGRVLDYWEREFGGVTPVVNKMGEKFYTRQDILTILKIKQLMIVEKVEKSEIKKIIAQESGKFHGNHVQEMVTNNKTGAGDLKIIRKKLQEILTILDKNGK